MAITASTTSAPAAASATWFLRIVVWFPTAYTIVIIAHEGAHALSAVALGFPSTLFNFWVDHQFTGATVVQRAIVGAAGPVASLVLGVVAAIAYRVVPRPATLFVIVVNEPTPMGASFASARWSDAHQGS